MDILHVHTKGRKLDSLEQLEIYKHTKTNKNDILNEQTQFKSHALFEHITPHTHKTSILQKSTPSPKGQCPHWQPLTKLIISKNWLSKNFNFYP